MLREINSNHVKEDLLYGVIYFKCFLIITLLILLCSAGKAQTLGWTKYQGQGLNNVDIYKVHELTWVAPQQVRAVLSDGSVVYSDNNGQLWWRFQGVDIAIYDMSQCRDEGNVLGRSNEKYHSRYGNFQSQSEDSATTDTIWVVGSGGAILFSSNTGANWLQQTSGITGDIYSVDFPDNHNGWAADDQGHIIHTTNAGNNWVLQSSLALTIFRLFFSDILNGWVTGFGSFVEYTSNGGANWIDRTPPGVDPVGYIWCMQFWDQNTGWMGGQNYGSYSLFRTTNGGVHWDSCTVSPAPSIIWGLSFVNSSTGYACGPSSIFKTTNGGVSWTSQTVPSGTPILYDIKFLNPDTGYAVGQNATVMYTTSGGEPIGIRTISNSVPKNFALGQNYPNPFNPTTNFKIQISRLSDVRVTVYNILGKLVTKLVNQQLKPGTYEVTWDARNYPSGVYFYKLSTTDFTETKKMVLVK